ncbi:hypothetical protein GUJ93_ZPchr0002g26260 [Zizania palustris]|uniref:Uncharacterized protein n=1 Tax=Zizania palustris TaxID=103762 RepID=A0A8J5S4C2_ZIZPA|nr:hypothetical protein GUJ93_ZPchr0002g26260 [Zizania palustris]
MAIAVGSNKAIVHEPVRVGDSVEQVAGITQRAMVCTTSRQRTIGREDLRGYGSHREGAVDDDVAVELAEMLDGVALAQELLNMAGSDNGRGGCDHGREDCVGSYGAGALRTLPLLLGCLRDAVGRPRAADEHRDDDAFLLANLAELLAGEDGSREAVTPPRRAAGVDGETSGRRRNPTLRRLEATRSRLGTV